MLTPTLPEFEAKAREGNLIPVYREILADLLRATVVQAKQGGERD